MPDKGKDLTGQIVAHLRSHGGEAGLSLQAMPKLLGCSPSGFRVALMELRQRNIIKKTADERGGGPAKGLPARYVLASEEFKTGESWREVYRSFRKPRIEKSPTAPALQVVEQTPGNDHNSGVNPLTSELVEVYLRGSRIQAEMAPLQKRNEELEQKLRDASIEIQRLSDELEEVSKALTRHRENERIAEQRLTTLRRENAVAMSGSKVTFDGQGFQIEKKLL